MSLLDFLGAGKSITDAQNAVSQVVQELDPLLRDVENRMEGIISTNLDRIDGATVTITATATIKLNPIPKATSVE